MVARRGVLLGRPGRLPGAAAVVVRRSLLRLLVERPVVAAAAGGVAELAADRQADDPHSTLSLYRHALRARARTPGAGRRGAGVAQAESRPGTLAFERSPGFVRTANATDTAVE
ncbi:hypothetical protein ACU686_44140 [Yinghuangia aomiensis]